jgi:hypothetical protein
MLLTAKVKINKIHSKLIHMKFTIQVNILELHSLQTCFIKMEANLISSTISNKIQKLVKKYIKK